MNERLKQLEKQCWSHRVDGVLIDGHLHFDTKKFAELIIRECIQVAANQRNPSNLNYKPSERFVQDLKLHFGVEGGDA